MSLTAIEKVVGRLRWRRRAQIALRHGLLLGAIGLFVFAAAVMLVKARLVPSDVLWVGGVLAILLPGAGILWGVLTRLSDIDLAASLDAAGGLHSRLGSALAFARLPVRTPMQEAAMQDALSVVAAAEPKKAAPWRWAVFASGAIALAAAAAATTPAVWVFEAPVGIAHGMQLARVGPAPKYVREAAEVRPEDQERLKQLGDELKDEVKTAADETVKAFLDELNDLIRALQEGRLTPEEAHARMAALDKAMKEWKEDKAKGAEEVEKRLQEAAQKQRDTHEELAPVMDALKENDYKAAAEALEKLADKVEQDRLALKDQKAIAKDMEELAKALENERQKEKERLEKERDRLKEKEQREKDRFAKKDKDRLEDHERRLEELDDPQRQEQMSEPERQLEQLSDELDEAARDLLRRMSEQMDQMAGQQGDQGAAEEQRREQPGDQGDQGQNGEGGQERMSAEDMRRAAEALRKMAQGGQGRQQMRIANGRMIDVREMMRRGAGQSGKNGQGGKNGQDAQSRQGIKPDDDEGEDAEDAFERGANGEGEGKDSMIMLGEGKPGGKPGDMLLLGGGKDGQGLKIPGRGDGSGGAKLGQGGEQAGEGHDPNLYGGRQTTMDGVKTHEDFVAGQHGDGQSQTKIVMTAAQKGFASRQYREVHQDYAGVVEDALEKEHIPPGKRTYVRRYFDLIRPR